MNINDFLNLLEPPVKYRDGSDDWVCRCPAHNDKWNSLRVRMGRNKRREDVIQVICFAGCDRQDILRHMGLTQEDLICGR